MTSIKAFSFWNTFPSPSIPSTKAPKEHESICWRLFRVPSCLGHSPLSPFIPQSTTVAPSPTFFFFHLFHPFQALSCKFAATFWKFSKNKTFFFFPSFSHHPPSSPQTQYHVGRAFSCLLANAANCSNIIIQHWYCVCLDIHGHHSVRMDLLR